MATTATAHTDRKPSDAELPDARLGALLDAVDERTAAQTRLNDELGAGFLWLARERYRDALAIERLGEVARDERDMQTHQRVDVRVAGDGNVEWTRDTGALGDGGAVQDASAPGLRRRRGAVDSAVAGDGAKTAARRGASRYVGIPSKEVREAVSSFERAVDAAIALAGVQARVAATVGKTNGEGTT